MILNDFILLITEPEAHSHARMQSWDNSEII